MFGVKLKDMIRTYEVLCKTCGGKGRIDNPNFSQGQTQTGDTRMAAGFKLLGNKV